MLNDFDWQDLNTNQIDVLFFIKFSIWIQKIQQCGGQVRNSDLRRS